MLNPSKVFFSPKTTTILIFGILVLCYFIPGWIETLRFGDYNKLWGYGNALIKATVYSMFLWSFVMPFIIWIKDRKVFRRNILWVIIGFTPYIYFIVLAILSS